MSELFPPEEVGGYGLSCARREGSGGHGGAGRGGRRIGWGRAACLSAEELLRVFRKYGASVVEVGLKGGLEALTSIMSRPIGRTNTRVDT